MREKFEHPISVWDEPLHNLHFIPRPWVVCVSDRDQGLLQYVTALSSHADDYLSIDSLDGTQKLF